MLLKKMHSNNSLSELLTSIMETLIQNLKTENLFYSFLISHIVRGRLRKFGYENFNIGFANMQKYLQGFFTLYH